MLNWHFLFTHLSGLVFLCYHPCLAVAGTVTLQAV